MTPLRLLLNSGFTGANAFFALADERGLFRAAGLDVQFTPGRGAYTAAARLYDEGFDAAYGDVNALIEIAALHPTRDPALAVLMVHQQSPSVITVAKAGPIRQPADLAGRTLIGHASDVALRTFGAYAKASGLVPASVKVQASDDPVAGLLQTLLQGRADGVFGYFTTHTAALAGLGQRAQDMLRFLPFRDVCPSLYGSALMVAPRLLRDDPHAASQLVQCVRAGIALAQAEPDAAIDAVLLRSPHADRAIEHERWRGTRTGDMAAAAGQHAVPGDVEERRWLASIRCLADAQGWQLTPAPDQVFTRRFL